MKKIFTSVLLMFLLISSVTAVADIPIYRNAKITEKKISLTFDDGPHPTLTPKILQLLDKYKIKATFFVIGINTEKYPEIAKCIVEKGHELGNHTYNHINGNTKNPGSFENEIQTTHNIVSSVCNYDLKLIRPPGGAINQNVTQTASKLGYKIVLWDIDTKDWAHKSTKSIKENILKNISNGSIILFHDYISGESHTLEALEEVIPTLIEKGYEFVTVGELLN